MIKLYGLFGNIIVEYENGSEKKMDISSSLFTTSISAENHAVDEYKMVQSIGKPDVSISIEFRVGVFEFIDYPVTALYGAHVCTCIDRTSTGEITKYINKSFAYPIKDELEYNIKKHKEEILNKYKNYNIDFKVEYKRFYPN